MRKPKGYPIAAFPYFPFPKHRTMAEVMEQEAVQRAKWREKYSKQRKSMKTAELPNEAPSDNISTSQ